MRSRLRTFTLQVAVVLLMLSLPGSASVWAMSGLGRVVARLDTASLHLSQSVIQGAQFAVLDSDVVVLAEGESLLVFQNNTLRRRVTARCRIYCLSLNREGNGVIVGDSILFRVNNMRIDPVGVVVIPFWSDRWGFIERVYFDDDSTLTLVPNAGVVVLQDQVDKLNDSRITVLTDSLSKYIAERSNWYIGCFGRERFFCDFGGEDGAVRLTAFQVIDGQRVNERIMDIGYLGEFRPPWGPCPFDRERGLFYIATLQDGCLVIREFDIRDFVPGE